MTHPLQADYDARKSLVHDMLNGYCHVGGLENFAKARIIGDNAQYGHSHIVDHNYSDRSECIFCGREILQKGESNYITSCL